MRILPSLLSTSIFLCGLLGPQGLSLSHAATSTLAASASAASPIHSSLSWKALDAPLPDADIFTLTQPNLTAGFLSKTKYENLRDATMELLRRYDPSTHYFIGTGRDPAPLIAALEVIGGRELAMSFPASNLVNNRNITPKLIGKYFERLIPDAAMRRQILKGKRTLVLLDQSNTGKTPNSLEPYFRAYLQSIGAQTPMVKVAFAPSPRSILPGVQFISTAKFPDVARYLYPPYEGVISEYPRHVLGANSISDLVRRTPYRQFVAALKRRMAEDLELHRFIVGPLKGSSSAKVELEIARRDAALLASRTAAARSFSNDIETRMGAVRNSLVTASDTTKRYFSPNAARLNAWMEEALTARLEIQRVLPDEVVPTVNDVTQRLIFHASAELQAGRISKADFRRLLGHALSASEAGTELQNKFGSMHGYFGVAEALRDGKEYFLHEWENQRRAGTESMAARYTEIATMLESYKARGLITGPRSNPFPRRATPLGQSPFPTPFVAAAARPAPMKGVATKKVPARRPTPLGQSPSRVAVAQASR